MTAVAWNGAALITMSCPSTCSASAAGSVMSTGKTVTPLLRSGVSAASSRSSTVTSNSGAAESNCTIAWPILPAPTSVNFVAGPETIEQHYNMERPFHSCDRGRLTVVERTDDGPSLKRDLALATWSLFVGLALLLLAAGLFGTLLGVR